MTALIDLSVGLQEMKLVNTSISMKSQPKAAPVKKNKNKLKTKHSSIVFD